MNLSNTVLQEQNVESSMNHESSPVAIENEDMTKLTLPMLEEETMTKESQREYEHCMQKEAQMKFDDSMKEQRMKRLKYLLKQSDVYTSILGQRLAKDQDKIREKGAKMDAAIINEQNDQINTTNKSKKSTRKSTPDQSTKKSTKRRKTTDSQYQLEDYLDEHDVKRLQNNNSIATAIKHDNEIDNDSLLVKPSISARQPSLVTGGVLRDYQLAGVEWLISLWENGLNGILADEMGLGKTVQTISLFAHLKAMKVSGPFLIVAPLSTLANWVIEFKRFTPTIPVLLYHGTKAERQKAIRHRIPITKQTDKDFPIVVTNYEIVMNDRKYLQKYNWKYIVVDEGHRLKNMNCKLIQELKTYSSANRLLLTGTPLQNNLAELWSLLNFLLPDIFDSLDIFQSWFDFSDIEKKSGQERIMKEEHEDQIISSLHSIMKPFLLRRLKSDVERSLPKKKEYILYAPLTRPQKNLYNAILNRNLRDYLIKRMTANGGWDDNTALNLNRNADADQQNTNAGDGKRTTRQRSSRSLKTINYKEATNREFFNQQQPHNLVPITHNKNIEAGRKHEIQTAIKHVNSLHLQNLIMQLRKVCNHPFLFDWPTYPNTDTYVMNNDLAAQSGKVLLLDRLLTSLFDRGHKVLVFSQMTKMLDILEAWATELKNWRICRLDGSVSQESRLKQIEEFNNPESSINLFLLSTRAGGLGINLTGADTVIIFDSDWNPQIDLQAQSRVHRIGQTKPVLIYRLVAASTVEAKILKRANSKRRLEKLVITKGKFKAPIGKKEQEGTMNELAEILASEDGEQVQIVAQGEKVISDEDLEKILDRSDHTMDFQNTSSNGRFEQMDTEIIKDTNNKLLATRISIH